jgi:hypothetical protein
VCPDDVKRGFSLKQKFAGVFGEWVRDLAHWEAFGTFTFAKEVSVWGAALCIENFVAEVIPWVKCFYAVERHKAHGGHPHALFAHCGEIEWKHGPRQKLLVASMNGVDVWHEWFRRYGRNSIEMPRKQDDTARYCAKYLTKEAALWNHNFAAQFELRERGNPMRVQSVTAWAAARERQTPEWSLKWVFPGSVIEA